MFKAYPPKLCADCGAAMDGAASHSECRHCRKCYNLGCSHYTESARRIAAQYENIAKALAELEALEDGRPWHFHKDPNRAGLAGCHGIISRDPEGFWYAEMDERKLGR